MSASPISVEPSDAALVGRGLSTPSLETNISNIPEQKLDQVASAIERVADVQKAYEPKIAAAPQPEKERLVNEADNALQNAVTKDGLSVEEYNGILNTAQSDPGVRQKIVQRLKPPAK